MLLVLAGLALVVGVPLAVQQSTRHALEAEYAAIRASGAPVTLEEMADAYRPSLPEPGQEEVAEVYREAVQTLPKPGEDSFNNRLYEALDKERSGGALPDDARALLTAYVEYNAENLQRLHVAARAGFAPAELDLNQGIKLELAHISEDRRAVRMLWKEALFAADSGDTARAVEAMLAAMAVAESLRGEPILVSQYVRKACQSLAIDAWMQSLALAAFSDEELTEMGRAFATAEDKSAMARSMAFERSMGLAMFDDPELVSGAIAGVNPDDVFPGGGRFVVMARRVTGFMAADKLRYMDYMGQICTASKLPYPEMLSAMESIDNSFDEDRSWLPRFSYASVAPLARAGWSFARIAAWLRTAASAAAVERFRLEYGLPPGDLSDLVPPYLAAVPEDPFDGDPLRYRRDGEGYVIYSVDVNRQDDGGTAGERIEEGDLVFRVER